jgi:hypothetical protein
MLLEVEDSESGLPLVAMHGRGRLTEVVVEALCELSDGVGKHVALVVVAIGGMALYAIFLPCVGVDGVFLCPYLVPLEEHGDRFARHLPTTYANAFGSPALEERFALFEGEIGMVAEVGTEEDNFVFMFLLHGSGTGRKHGIDAAYTIAYLPASFKNIFWLHVCCL